MKTVNVSDARRHFGELLRKVSSGETVRITRRGLPVANLVPAEPAKDLKKIVQEIREIAKGVSLNGLTIRQLIDEGRRY